MATDAATPPPPDLPALYRAAVETGDAAELVRALCLVHGVSLRGLAELAGISYLTLRNWQAGKTKALDRTLRDLAPLLKPTKALLRRVVEVRLRLPFGLKGRPQKKDSSI